MSTPTRTIIIGSRGSDLALWQANFVKAELENLNVPVEIKIIKTKGDEIQHLSFDKMEGKGFFTKEIEAALLAKEVDLAVHSHKDLETTTPPGLTIAAVSERANPADLLLIRKEAADKEQKWMLKEGAVVGTSSARRKLQLIVGRPDVTISDLRGNVPTRINKLRSGQYDAILLAAAGIERLHLNLSDLVVQEMDPNKFLPAPAQGVLALQIRESDSELHKLLQQLNNSEVEDCIKAERLVLKSFKGGCQLPLGAFCEKTEAGFTLRAVMSPDWKKLPVYADATGPDPQKLAIEVFETLKKKSR